MTIPNDVKNIRLVYLFEIELKFQWEMPPITSCEAGEGEYIGSGTGTVTGSKVGGTIRWGPLRKA